jgi:DNA-binding GntR family transcriptional regulator
MVPFFNTYIRQSEADRPFLRSSYAQYLSKDQRFKLSFISGASNPGLLEAIETFRKTHP